MRGEAVRRAGLWSTVLYRERRLCAAVDEGSAKAFKRRDHFRKSSLTAGVAHALREGEIRGRGTSFRELHSCQW